MTPTREGLEQIRHQLAQHVQRGEQIITNAESYRDWPTHCDGSTMLYAVEVSINALSILERAAEAVGRRKETLTEPISDQDFAELSADCADMRSAGMTAEDTMTARSALARRLAASAAELIKHAEDVLEGKENLDGEPSRRNPLYDK